MREQRRHERVRTNLDARWESSSHRGDGTITDLSEGGCYILSSGDVGVGSIVDIEVEVPSVLLLRVRGRVVNSDTEIGFAIQFEDLRLAEQKMLARLLNHLRGKIETLGPSLSSPPSGP